jgi:hypothetical protein
MLVAAMYTVGMNSDRLHSGIMGSISGLCLHIYSDFPVL